MGCVKEMSEFGLGCGGCVRDEWVWVGVWGVWKR